MKKIKRKRKNATPQKAKKSIFKLSKKIKSAKKKGKKTEGGEGGDKNCVIF